MYRLDGVEMPKYVDIIIYEIQMILIILFLLFCFFFLLEFHYNFLFWGSRVDIFLAYIGKFN